MRILSIDASTKKTGWALFDKDKLVEYGCIESNKIEWRSRVLDMTDELDKVVKRLSPNRIIIEDVPLQSANPQTMKMLCVLQGVLLGMSIGNKVYIEFIQPTTWRSKIGLFDGTQKGKERNEMKKKSIEFANDKFGLNLIYKSPSSKYNEDDLADAICLGYSYNRVSFGRKLL